MYYSLRSSGKLSYEVVEKMFEDHQGKWPERIFNEDSWYKYLAPLEEDGDAAYLSMLQGAKAEQRKWWLYNRFRFMDSKFLAGDALTDVITLRAYQKGDITVTPYADIYVSIKYGSYTPTGVRTTRGTATTVTCPLSTFNDTEIYVYSASQIASVGDLSPLQVGYANFSMATKLQSLKLGDSSASYNNSNLQELYLGNNTLLRTLDVRNCSGLGTGDQSTVDISGCTNIQNVYFDGTSVLGVTLPDGGSITVLHLPSTITILKAIGQLAISDFTCPDTSNITTLWLDNVSDAIDGWEILQGIASGSRVRLQNFSWEFTDAHDILSLLSILDTMRGLDANGNNTANAQVKGTIYCPLVSSWVLNQVATRYPEITITYDTVGYTVFYFDDASSLISWEIVESGEDAAHAPTPVKTPTNTIVYTFTGWAATVGGTVDSSFLENITAETSVYAVFTSATRYYTVRFYNNRTLVYTQYVTYGSAAQYYDAESGSSTPTYNGSGSPLDYEFTEWSPAVDNITEDTNTYAQYRYNPSYTRNYLAGNTLYSYTDQNSLSSVGEYAFAALTVLDSLVMANLFSGTGAEIPEGCFFNMYATNNSALQTFTMNQNWQANVTAIKAYAFGGAYLPASTVLSFPNLTELGARAFYYCRGVVSFSADALTSVGAYAFGYMPNLAFLSLASLQIMFASTVLRNTTHLTSLLLPSLTGTAANNTTIGAVSDYIGYSQDYLSVLDLGYITRFTSHQRALTSLKTLVLRSGSPVTFSATSVYSSGFLALGCPIAQGTGKIYVPSALISTYQAATGWSTYASAFAAIEGSEWEL